jgi:hypothetical protein
VTLTEFNQLVEVTVLHGVIEIGSRLPTVRQPNSVAVDPQTLCTYVAGVSPATLEVDCPR